MLKILLLYLSKSKKLQSLFMKWRVASNFALRFIAGETIDDGINTVLRLNKSGFYVTVDFLGEQTISEKDALKSTMEIVRLLERIHSSQIKANISIKLSQIGLMLGEEFCKQNFIKILQKAKETKNFIRIDMEDSSVTDLTLKILLWARTIYNQVGIVIQSYLFRSENDVEDLLEKQIPIRMVKGAYKESNKISFKKISDVDANFVRLSQKIIASIISKLDDGRDLGKFPPVLAIGTHDEKIIKIMVNEIKNSGLPKTSLEIQMLYGIRSDLQSHYLQEGYPIRIYLPYGTHWYPYFMRRLAERPANLWFFVKNLFR
jgi:proline dehydrogenase